MQVGGALSQTSRLLQQEVQQGSATWKALSAEEKALGFGALVLREFQSIAPTPENGDRFMKWLLDVHMTAPAIVAFDPEPKAEP